MSDLRDDLRDSLRSLRRTPAFTAAAIGILALGIGANTAIFSLVEPLLFSRLAISDPDRVVRLFALEGDGGLSNSSSPVYEDYRDGTTSFSGLAAFCEFVPLHLAIAGAAPSRVNGALVSSGYFGVLGVTPALGRFFDTADEETASPVVVLSNRFWRRAFASDPGIVGKRLRLNRRDYTVAGVAPAGFYGASLESLPEIWLPISLVLDAEPDWGREVGDRGMSWLDIVGRLKPGVSIRQAQSELDVLAARRAAGQPEGKQDPRARVVASRDAVVNPGDTERANRLAWILSGIVLLVLSITCADTAGLLLARADRRRREMAIRTALGASRGRLTRRLLTEALVLSLAGAAAGLAVATWIVEFVRAVVPPDFPIPVEAAASVLDTRVLAFTILAATATGIAFGLLPARKAAGRDAWTDLKGAPRSGGRARLATRDAFSVALVALCCVLLVGAGLLLRTLIAEHAISPGFDPENAVVFSVDLARQGYPPQSHPAVFERLAESIRRAPGVRAVAAARMVPVDGSGMVITLDRTASARSRSVDFNPVGPGFYAALGTPLLRGREFDGRDNAGAPAVAVVNQALAQREWPGTDPVGRVLTDVGPMRGPLRIVGVVADAKFRSLREPARPMLSVPLAQFSRPTASVLVRTTGDPAAAVAGIRAAVASVDRDLPVFAVRSLRDRMGRSLGSERLFASLLGAFGVLALALAGAGLYGVVASSAEMRRREFGIRLALGARRGQVLRLVLSRGLLLAGLGLGAGIPAAVLATKALSSLLYGVTASDPSTFAAAASVLGAVAALSGLMPALRASRTDPMEALRSE